MNSLQCARLFSWKGKTAVYTLLTPIRQVQNLFRNCVSETLPSYLSPQVLVVPCMQSTFLSLSYSNIIRVLIVLIQKSGHILFVFISVQVCVLPICLKALQTILLFLTCSAKHCFPTFCGVLFVTKLRKPS